MDNNYRRSALDWNALHSGSMAKVIEDIQTKMAKATDNMILQQLNEFISRGLIVVETVQPMMVREADSNKITIRQSVRLVLKDQEYIQTLENRVIELEAALASSIATTSPVRK